MRVEPGEYLRGFNHDEQGEHRFNMTHQYSNRQELRYEKPAHRVLMTMPYEIAKTEITVAQFSAFVEATDYKTEAEQSGGA